MRNTFQNSGAAPRLLVLILVAVLFFLSAGTGELSATTSVDTTATIAEPAAATPVTAQLIPGVLTTTTLW